ncbi:MAG: pyridoxamine 5'-phosphate oxidase [Chitinivibrionales bacterium]|nr:pyridoxamine 5'-phosphate oxidase [Chitinivibrionales bacterium]
MNLQQKYKSPYPLFKDWIAEAEQNAPADFDHTAMSLGTRSLNGRVSLRTVLLKHYSRRGFTFFTDYRSTKSQQLAQNPQAALLFYWPYLGRQIRISGNVQKISARASASYFHNRPFESQCAAFVSRQSQRIDSRQQLLSKHSDAMAKFAPGPVPCPDHWGGYRLVPQQYEFWQAGEYRLHDRLQFARNGASWSMEWLSP